jgi:hypothetical protein
MDDFKDRMIEAIERGEATDLDAYEIVRDRMADLADVNEISDGTSKLTLLARIDELQSEIERLNRIADNLVIAADVEKEKREAAETKLARHVPKSWLEDEQRDHRKTKEELTKIRQVLLNTLNLASVAHEGDPWYAENAGIDAEAVLAEARRVLGES